MIITLTFPGIPPSKKNSKQIRYNPRTNRRFITSSDNHKAWHHEMMYRIKQMKIRSYKGEVLPMTVTFYPPDKRRHDSTNVTDSLQDLFVDAGIIEDDNWSILSDIHLRLGHIDPINPRVEIEIL